MLFTYNLPPSLPSPGPTPNAPPPLPGHRNTKPQHSWPSFLLVILVWGSVPCVLSSCLSSLVWVCVCVCLSLSVCVCVCTPSMATPLHFEIALCIIRLLFALSWLYLLNTNLLTDSCKLAQIKQTKRMILFKCMCALDWILLNGPMFTWIPEAPFVFYFPADPPETKRLCVKVRTACARESAETVWTIPQSAVLRQLVQIHSGFLTVWPGSVPPASQKTPAIPAGALKRNRWQEIDFQSGCFFCFFLTKLTKINSCCVFIH